jgi:hypothetical protein
MKQRPRIYYSDNQKALMWSAGRKERRSTGSLSYLIDRIPRCTGSWLRQAGYDLLSASVQGWP